MKRHVSQGNPFVYAWIMRKTIKMRAALLLKENHLLIFDCTDDIAYILIFRY